LILGQAPPTSGFRLADDLRAARKLDLHYTQSRYPSGLGVAPEDLYDAGISAEAEQWAAELIEFAESCKSTSAAFEGLKPWERTEPLVAAWPIEGPVELVAYTPAEWERLATWTFPSTIRTEGREIQPQPGCTAADPAETT
jgi:hypothetical protein